MKKITIIYWIFTGLLVALMLFSGISNAMVTKESVEMLSKHLGYPTYIIAFLGFAKAIGALTLLVPGYKRLKEWVYAGFTFDLAGAMYSSIAIGDAISQWFPLIIGFIIIGLSYIYHYKRIQLKKATSGSLR